MSEYRHIEHDLSPVFDENSHILILGSLPSVQSRGQFFYNHPQNRFWKVLAAVAQHDPLLSIEEKKAFLSEQHIAVWDVIASCDIIGSSDSSIKNVVPNNLDLILKNADIKQIFVNGKTAYKLYNRYMKEKCEREALCLPSTSPANAVWSMERLIEAWSIIGEY